jgi:hypothetical protein
MSAVTTGGAPRWRAFQTLLGLGAMHEPTTYGQITRRARVTPDGTNLSVIVGPGSAVPSDRAGWVPGGDGLTQELLVDRSLTGIRCVARRRPRITGVT